MYPFFTSSFDTKRSSTFCENSAAIFISQGGTNFHTKLFRGKFEASNGVFILIPKDIEYFYLIFESLKNIHIPRLNQIVVSSIQLRCLTPSKIKNLEILIPDDKTLEKFNDFCENIQLKIENLQSKIEILDRTKKDLLNRIFNEKLEIY
ncbi:hypothetical protein PRV_01855 [Mycoplasma parvum str. Indiana]|uniref:Type I restriction modification DNA specificity domain-containing protein n=1 Tax=Mycoplasma parvum str. Indiana TaxID=1403316 RepID=U5NCF5_9MOLU|nr:hypothetical protein PRV_01855 [Mycoplasma parvum str. Indiana]